MEPVLKSTIAHFTHTFSYTCKPGVKPTPGVSRSLSPGRNASPGSEPQSVKFAELRHGPLSWSKSFART